MGRPRGSGKKKPSYWKWLRSHWRGIGIAAFLLFFFGAGFYLAQLYGEISQLIEERSAGLTSAIYSAPMVVSQGDDLARMHILDRLRSLSRSMAGWFVQDLDLRERSEALLTATPHGAVFLGCQIERTVEDSLRDRGALVFPEIVGLPFDPYRARLYTAAELYGDVAVGGAYADSPDARSNAWRLTQGTPSGVGATLAMSLHDHAIGDALMDAVDRIDRSHVVGVMGGHDVERGSRTYEDAAKLGLALTRAGMTVFTGGGPGAMEAVNLGARMAIAPTNSRASRFS